MIGSVLSRCFLEFKLPSINATLTPQQLQAELDDLCHLLLGPDASSKTLTTDDLRSALNQLLIRSHPDKSHRFEALPDFQTTHGQVKRAREIMKLLRQRDAAKKQETNDDAAKSGEEAARQERVLEDVLNGWTAVVQCYRVYSQFAHDSIADFVAAQFAVSVTGFPSLGHGLNLYCSTQPNWTPICTTKRSKCQIPGSAWFALPPAGYVSTGDMWVTNYDLPSEVPLALFVRRPELCETSDAARMPTSAYPYRFEKVWDDVGSGGADDWQIWRPIPVSAQYVAVGDVVTRGRGTTPALDSVCCIHRDALSAELHLPLLHRWDNRGCKTAKVKPFTVYQQPTMHSFYAVSGLEGSYHPFHTHVLNVQPRTTVKEPSISG